MLSMVVGAIAGLALNLGADHDAALFRHAVWWLDLIGKDLFIRGLRMIVAPLILASIVTGVASLPDPRSLGRIGSRTFLYYFSTTALAVFVGMLAVLAIRPGERPASVRIRERREARLAEMAAEFRATTRLDPESATGAEEFRRHVARAEGSVLETSSGSASWNRVRAAGERPPLEMIRQDILFPLLTNPFEALATVNALGIIFFAIILGIACHAAGEAARPLVEFFRALDAVMMRVTGGLMLFAPVAIGCLVASLLATLGMDALRSLGWYCATVILGIGIHVLLLLGLLRALSGASPLWFLRGFREAWLVAFATTSSAATLPVTMRCATERLGVRPDVARFGIPIGATVNMDGTALYEGVAVIFLVQIYGGLADAPFALDGARLLLIFVTASLAAVGAAAIPSAGLVTMALVAGAVGLPLHYIPLLFVVDHFLDMFRTSTNVLGDAVGAVIVSRAEDRRAAPLASEGEPPA